jgi:hypothetical protein
VNNDKHVALERLAREAGFTVDDGGIYVGQYLLTGTVARFAALVRAQALEDAAKVCESREKAWLEEASRHADAGDINMRDLLERQAYGNGESAAAIRAL